MYKNSLNLYLLLTIFGLFALQLSPRPSGQEISDAFIELRHIARTQRNAQCARSAINHYHSLVHDKSLNTALNERLAKRILYSNNTAIISRHRNQIHHEQMKLRTQKNFFYELLDSANDTEYEPIYVLYNDIESDESWLQKVSDTFGRKLHRFGQADLPHQPAHKKPTPTKKAQAPQRKATQAKPTPKKKVELSVEKTVSAQIKPDPQPTATPQQKAFIHKYEHNFFIEYFSDYNKSIGTDGYPEKSKIQYTSKIATNDANDIVPLRAIIGSTSEVDKNGALSFDQAENIHCWIQWAFPSPHKSAHNLKAPISNEVIKAKFNEEKSLRDALKRCLKFYLNFIGLSMSDATDPYFYRIGNDSTYKTRMSNFLTNTHNFARVTRILTSLRYHGLSDHARKLAAYLISENDYFKKTFSQQIPANTEKLWQKAIKETF